MKTVAQQWEMLAAQVMPPNAPAMQYQEMRRAFYAGFHAALMSGLAMAEESGDDDDAGAIMMESLHQECQQFAKEIAEGRA